MNAVDIPTIIYDYYPIECKLITSTSAHIDALYLGQQNRPNITYTEKNEYCIWINFIK